VLEPRLDVEVQQIRAVGEPALAFGREGQQDVLEPAESPFAVDGHQQPLPQGRLGHGGDEPLHPAVLLPRRGRVYPEVTMRVVGDLGAPGGGVGLSFDDGEEIPIVQVEEALLIRRIALEGDLQIAPIHGDGRHF
jgi:hypothetical protein